VDAPRNYQDESDGRWYQGYPDRYPSSDGRFDDDERYRATESRYADLGEANGDVGRYRERESYPEAEAYGSPRTDPGLVARNAGSLGPRSGVELPPLAVAQNEPAEPRFHTDLAESRYAAEPAESRFGGEPAESRFGGEPAEPRYGGEPGEPRYRGEPAESRFHTEPIDRAALRRQPPVQIPSQPAPPISGVPSMPPPPPMQPLPPAGPPGPMGGPMPGPVGGPMPGPGSPQQAPTMTVEPVGGAIYRTRHTGAAILLVVVAIVAELLTARMLLVGEFGHPFQPAAVLAGIFTMVGVPLTTMGLYGLITGAVTAGGPAPGRAWLRTPLAFLPIGLILIVAGALAV
jgi:hypothetical protein